MRLAAAGVGDKANGVGARAGKLDEHDLAELGAVFGAESLDKLLHAVVEAADSGDALDQPLAQGAEELPKEKMRQIAKQRDQQENDNRGHGIPEEGRQVHQGLGQVRRKKWREGTAHEANDQAQGPDGHHQRGDQEQAGQEGIAQGFEAGIGHNGGTLTQRRKDAKGNQISLKIGMAAASLNSFRARVSAARIRRFFAGWRSS